MKKILLSTTILTLGVVSIAMAQTYTLNWGTSFAGGWPTGSLARNAPNIGGSGVNCSAAISKTGGIYTTVLGPYGGPATPTVAASTFLVGGSSANLQLSLDFTTPTQYCDVVFTFSQPVFNVSFNIADIDRLHNTLNNYYDKITVTGYIGALSGPATITKYDAVTDPNFMFVSGNTAWVNTAYGLSGNSMSDASDQKGTIRVRFGGAYITSFRVRYENVAGVLADPTVQNIAIGNVSFMKSIPLPVKLTSIDGVLNRDQSVKLSWKTSEEKDFDFYCIERSIDGKEFEEIGMVQSQGFATTYGFIDNNYKGDKNYYRLKMVDVDGSFGYSKVIMIESGSEKDYSVYPTSVSDHVNVLFHSDKSESVLVVITSITGQIVYRKPFTAIRGQNKVLVELPSQLQSGTYMVSLPHRDEGTIIIKQ